MARFGHPSHHPRTLSYKDLPPPCEEERQAFILRLTALYDKINAQADYDRKQRLLSWSKWAP